MKENQNIEWKETWHDDYLKWICGFANAQGGCLVNRADKPAAKQRSDEQNARKNAGLHFGIITQISASDGF